VVSLFLGRWLFPLGSINHDEPMYAFDARLLLHGHLTLPASDVPFRPWASGVRGGRLVLKYTPVWPAMLAIGEGLGSMRLAAAAGAAAAVVLTGLLGRELFGRWREAVLAATVLVLSPLFFVQSGTLLPYVFQLALDVATMLLVLSAMRRWPLQGRAPPGATARLVGAGALWGVALFAREYDALLLAVPLVGAAVGSAWRHPRRLLAWAGWGALGAAVPVFAFLAHNAVVMGSPIRNAFTITGTTDALGFGRRGLFATSSFDYTTGDARTSVARNLSQFPGWTFGGALLVVVAALGLWRCRRQGAAIWAVAAIAVSFTIGYALFWAPYSIVELWPGARTLGPFYHLALLIPLSIFAASGLGALFDRNRAFGVLTLVALAAITALGVGTRLDRNRAVAGQYRAVSRVVGRANLGRTVLFLEDRGTKGFQSAAPFLENTPTLDKSVLYAVENGPGDLDVLARYSDRSGARLRTELRAGDQLLDPTRFVERLHVERGRTVILHFRIVNNVGAPNVITTFSAGNRSRTLVLDRASRRGATYEVAWTLSAVPRQGPTLLAVTNTRGIATVEAAFATPNGTTERYQRLYPYTTDPNSIRVLMPGVGRYLFQYGTAIWLNQDVTPTLAETGERSS